MQIVITGVSWEVMSISWAIEALGPGSTSDLGRICVMHTKKKKGFGWQYLIECPAHEAVWLMNALAAKADSIDPEEHPSDVAALHRDVKRIFKALQWEEGTKETQRLIQTCF